jgi:protoheme IX farnesyltransferase
MRLILTRLGIYWPLIKSSQTGLLLATGLAGYMSASCPITHRAALAGLAGSLFLAISGSTVLNMWCDRDIDCRMERTRNRTLAAGRVGPREALCLGLVLSLAGVGWAMAMDPLYGLVVSAGLFFDVVIYSMWLKRRTAWSIVWGGISGAMPILAGRALSTGSLDWIGAMLALSILFWIPTHILTFSMKYFDDYQAAGIPTFPSACGFPATRVMIAVSSLLAALMMGLAAFGIGMTWGYLRVLAWLSVGLLALAGISLIRPSERLNFGLFKYASAYMLSSMMLVVMYGL